jgi:hypothetical protein
MVAQKMLYRKDTPNQLFELVEKQGLHKRSLFKPIKDLNQNELSDFPKLTKKIFEEEINFGTFQLKHSLSYLAEHFNQHNGNAELSINIQDSGEKIVTCKIHSRHYSTKEYRVYVIYQPIDLKKTISSKKSASEFILGFYCECKNGNRTLGSFCHASALIYYLSVLRHDPILPQQPAHSLLSIFPNNLNFYKLKGNINKSQETKKKSTQKNLIESSQDEFSSSESELEIETSKKSNNFLGKKRLKQSQSAQYISVIEKLYTKSPGWGGQIIQLKNKPATKQYEGFIISNTCSFDYFLHGMWISTLLSKPVKSFMSNSIMIDEFEKDQLNKMFSYIEKGNWNHAKSIWILEFLKLVPNDNKEFSTFDSTFDSLEE